jgi:hypothetical protein
MRVRWHKWLLLAAWVSACGLNPQPDLPAGRPTNDGGNDPSGAAGHANGSGGGGLVISPSDGGTGNEVPNTPAGGRPDLGSAAGATGDGGDGPGEGGAGNDAGAGNAAGAGGDR